MFSRTCTAATLPGFRTTRFGFEVLRDGQIGVLITLKKCTVSLGFTLGDFELRPDAGDVPRLSTVPSRFASRALDVRDH